MATKSFTRLCAIVQPFATPIIRQVLKGRAVAPLIVVDDGVQGCHYFLVDGAGAANRSVTFLGNPAVQPSHIPIPLHVGIRR
jgi:hypothetical protein